MEPKEKYDHEAVDRLNESNWIWGFFYYNRKDKNFFVLNRKSPPGWTINFASPYSILAVIGIIALIVLAEWLKSV